jgi:transcriptional regulator with XRE-family HTH domain
VSIGEALRQAREQMGVSPEEVENRTKIRRKYIIAMENDDFEVLPGGVYVRGFLRNYARFLNIDGEALVRQYDELYRQHDETEQVPDKGPAGAERKNLPNRRSLAFIAVALLVLGLVYWTGAFNINPQGKISGNMDKQMSSGDKPGAGPGGQNKKSGVSGPAEQSNENNKTQGMDVVLKVINKECWMRVVVDEKDVVFEGTVGPGNTKVFRGNESIQVRLGDAGAVRVIVNGEDYGFLGAPGNVVDRVFRVGTNQEESAGG